MRFFPSKQLLIIYKPRFRIVNSYAKQLQHTAILLPLMSESYEQPLNTLEVKMKAKLKKECQHVTLSIRSYLFVPQSPKS